MYQWESEVRDSELDLQGIVNNSVYFTYMEHCRHKHAKFVGTDFNDLHQRGFDLLARDCEIQFKDSLKSGDEFVVTSTAILHSKVRIIFMHEIIRKSDLKVVTKGQFTITGINRNTGKIMIPD